MKRISEMNPLNILKKSKILIYLSLTGKTFKCYYKNKVVFLDRKFVYHFFNSGHSNYHLANEPFKFHLHNWCQF